MEGITHRNIHMRNNGLSIHIAEQGSGPVVLLLHGFPEVWTSWRHQISVLAEAGFHVIAPDMRGYGRSDAPTSADEYTSLHIVGDFIGLLDALSEKEAFVVGHDWGALIGWDLCLLRPDRVKAYVAVSVPFFTRMPDQSFYQTYLDELGEGFYIHRFQAPGRAENEFASVGTSEVLRKRIASSHRRSLAAPEGKENTTLPKVDALPLWFTQEDLDYLTEQFENTGFTGSLNYYRAIDRTWELKAPWTNMGVKTPCLFIAGDRDQVLELPGLKDYIHGGDFTNLVPNLKDVIVLKGGHFIHEEQSAKFNELVINFFKDCQPEL